MNNIQRLAEKLSDTTHGALITSDVSRRYFCGFKSSAGVILVTKDCSYLIIDSRYYDKACQRVTDCEVLRFTREQFHHMWSTCSDMSMYILTVHCERLMRSGNDKIDSECMFLREKVFRLIQQNLNEQNYFLYTKDILAEMAGVSMRSLNRSLSELKQLRLISISSGAIRLQI